MTNISDRNVDSKDYKAVHKELERLIARLNSSNASHLLDSLLTETEQIMIVKRFGAVFMFSQQFTPYRVSQTLDISEPTASRIFEQYCDKKFDKLLGCIRKKEQSAFLALILDLINARASSRSRTRLYNRALSSYR